MQFPDHHMVNSLEKYFHSKSLSSSFITSQDTLLYWNTFLNFLSSFSLDSKHKETN